MKRVSRRTGFVVIAVCVGASIAVRTLTPNHRAASARSLYNVVTPAGGYIVTHELSSHWTINVESAHSLTSTDCYRICAVLDHVPNDVTIGLVANINNPARSVEWIAQHARCNSMVLVCANGPIPKSEYFLDAIPEKSISVHLRCNEDISGIVGDLRIARPDAALTSGRYSYD